MSNKASGIASAIQTPPKTMYHISSLFYPETEKILNGESTCSKSGIILGAAPGWSLASYPPNSNLF